MIANLQPYPEYKDSGTAWLGRLPTHWGLVRLGSVLRERRETNEAKQVAQVLSVLKDVGVIRYEDKGNIGNKKSEDIGRYKIVRPDDIVVNCMNVIIGSVGRSRYTGCLSPVYYVLTRRSEADDPRYLAAIFSAKPFHESLVRIGNGILAHRMRIPMELLKCEPFPVPPADEQAAMVRFLDYANGRLERAIRAKRKVIALLHEQKQAIIHRAVTRGLGPAVPLKPSGIAWLSDIPMHWEVTRLKFEATHIVDCLHATPKYIPDGPFPAIRTADIEPGKVRLSQARRLSAQDYARWTSRLVPREGDILYSREGERFGIAALVPKEVQLCISQRMMIFRIKSSQLSEFLMWQLNCKHVFAQASCDIIGSTAPHVNVEQIKNYRLVMPPRQEQEQIVAYIAKECSTLNTAINRLEREIALLREYRTRLVADVVTGKLDVRGVTLPAEPEPPAGLAAETIEQDSSEPEEAENPSDTPSD